MSEKENSTGDYRFTIIIPVYNEEENLYTLEEKLQQFLPHSLFQACVLFVDDGSKDDSQRRIREICACIDTAAKREGETDAGTPLSAVSRHIKISSVESFIRAVYRLFRLSLDEEKIYQLSCSGK
jgi:glycosyltransferase involved in cell wall biosynthesis